MEIPGEGKGRTSPASMDDLVDALCRHREILRRETEYLKGEVESRGFATTLAAAGKKKAYMSRRRRSIDDPSPLLLSELSKTSQKGSSAAAVGVVTLPHLVSTRQDSLQLLLHETHHLRYRIQSLASILPAIISDDDHHLHKVKMLLFLMARAAVDISKTMQQQQQHSSSSSCSKQDDDATYLSTRRFHWESVWGSHMGVLFDDITTLSPMHFTPCTPGIAPYSATICPALQIYSLKIVDLNVNLNWPLHVYGVVAARDNVDRNRNLIFYRSRANPQLVTQNDPFLRLTGPSRAIVTASTPIKFEVELRIKYPAAAEEERQEDSSRASFFRTYTWRSLLDTTPLFHGYACSAELSLEQLPRAIQATIVGVRVVAGSWPSTYGCRVSCSHGHADEEDDREVELLNCPALALDLSDDVKKSPAVGSDGYFALTRNVVSAQLESTLKVAIQALKLGGGPHSSHVEFPVRQYCQTSKASCSIVDCEVQVVVAWSLLIGNRLDLML